MPTPYDAVPGPEMFFYWSAALVTVLALSVILFGWVFFSYRKLFGLYVSIRASTGRWDNLLIPPDDITGDVFWFLVLAGVNSLLVAGGLFITGYAIHVL